MLNEPESSFVVRKARQSDAEMLTQFYNDNTSYYFSDLEDLHEHLVSFLAQTRKISLVAVPSQSQFSIVGFASVDLIVRPRGGMLGYLGEVLVDQSKRRLGLAKQLIASSLRYSALEGCHRVILHCEPKLKYLYSTFGFQEWDLGMKLEISDH
jgi:predicted N-acetyltransferase YhbS